GTMTQTNNASSCSGGESSDAQGTANYWSNSGGTQTSSTYTYDAPLSAGADAIAGWLLTINTGLGVGSGINFLAGSVVPSWYIGLARLSLASVAYAIVAPSLNRNIGDQPANNLTEFEDPSNVWGHLTWYVGNMPIWDWGANLMQWVDAVGGP